MIIGAFLAVAVVGIRHPWCLLGLGAAVSAIVPTRRVLGGATGRDLIAVLAGTARTEFLYAILVTAGLVIGR
jgi:1,4-dihydroxy-2-naphthoate octaprenyltransferase